MEQDASDRFETACRVKDTNPSNLNEVFSKYGCNTLEAKVPVVENSVAHRLRDANKTDQTFGTLELKNESGVRAAEGRLARTKDRPLHMVEVGRNVLIAAGKVRERSPIALGDLDNDLEEFMRETARIRTEKQKAREQRKAKEMSSDHKMSVHDDPYDVE